MRDPLRLNEWTDAELTARRTDLLVAVEELVKNAYPIDHGAQIGVEADDLYRLRKLLESILFVPAPRTGEDSAPSSGSQNDALQRPSENSG